MSGDSSIADMLEKMPSMDLITIAVLGLDAYIIYSQVDRFNRDALFSVSTDMFAIAFQATIALVVINLIEYLHDRKSDSGHGLR
ncbi:MAG: hypothetical protein ABEJ56_03165 [Candidatus Nanohaloarchaea archaeon]